ncbi:bacteriohemerythrin [Arenibaculum pallidiluteum]|uniref:bacteriohemerythrin n=1 Tax=Arenibaculum pallidiluteum TaxID=2812559 RepID=UPI001A9586A0|nr:bacteriohemerythrin [Arenibaculum pallidiluteum]
MSLIQWPGDLLIGHSAVDDDHRHLVEIINKLAEAHAAGRQSGLIGEILSELADYTAAHFEREERFMERVRYPGIDEHRLNHSQLIGSLSRIIYDFEMGRPVDQPLLDFLRHWLTDHIMRFDKRLAAYTVDQIPTEAEGEALPDPAVA